MADVRDCLILCQGLVQYAQALDLQMQICELKRNGYEKDVLLLLEHPPTITIGRNGNLDHLLADPAELQRRGVHLQNVDRGGDITFHGPGQMVGYPILSLQAGERDVHLYMRNLEESLIRLLAVYGIEAGREAQFTGVWTEKGKIGAMGVHISRWITRHGFALNVNTDLSFYGMIVPCGIIGRGVISMQKLLSCPLEVADIAERYVGIFGSVFNRNMIRISELDLQEELANLKI